MVKNSKLAILLKDYPFENGEPYFHNELNVLSERFEEILIFSNHAPTENKDFAFSIPENVKVFNIYKEASTVDKALVLIKTYVLRGGLFRTFRDLISRKKFFSATAFRAAIYYDHSSGILSSSIKDHLKKNGLSAKQFVWYSYWSDELSYVLANWIARQEIITGFARTHSHDIYEDRHPDSYLPYRSFIFQNLSSVLCISEHGRKSLVDRYFDNKSKFKLYRLGVPEQSSVQKSINESPFVIASLSHIVPVKNLEGLIEALSHWKGKPLHWHHIGAAKTLDYGTKTQLLAAKKLDDMTNVNYTLHGFIEPHLVINKLKEINPHVLVNSSFYEGIPVSLMETSSIGVPIVAPNVCGVPEIVVDGENGFTFNPLSDWELHDKINFFATMGDSDYQNLKSKSIKIQKERFSYKKNYSDLADLFQHSNVGYAD